MSEFFFKKLKNVQEKYTYKPSIHVFYDLLEGKLKFNELEIIIIEKKKSKLIIEKKLIKICLSYYAKLIIIPCTL